MRRGLFAVVIVAACSARTAPPEPTPAPAPSASVEPFAATSASASASGGLTAIAPDPPPKVLDEISTARFQAWIYEKPKTDAPHAGWLRAGMRVRRVKEVEGSGCKGKWFQIEPAGYLCEGHEGVTTNLNDPIVAAAAQRPPDTTSPFPYGYVTSNGSPLYVRIPTEKQQAAVEGDVAAHLAAVTAARAKMDPTKLPPLTAVPVGPIPSFLEDHKQAPNILPGLIPSGAVQISQAWKMMRLSILSAFESEGRTFYLTTEHFIVPADRMRAARLADFKGVELGEGAEELPMVWVRWKPPHLHKLENGKAVLTDQILPFQAHARVAKKDHVIDGTRFHELLATPAGMPEATYLVRSEAVNRVDGATELPYNVAADEMWIEVSLLKQTLVLYRGLKPLFITLVSTGVDVMGDPETSRATPKGHFRIHSKHLSWRMAGDEKPPAKEGDQPDPRYRIDDVPYVQYFQAGYALHAAFWHDSFGQPKSHGCINLSPRDALWLFGQTSPKVPAGWHGVYSGRAGAAAGTTLIVHL
jgi:hypothetical protein